MKRVSIAPRPDWREKVEALGFIYHTVEGACYWDESAYYEFTESEIDLIENATDELHTLCLDAVDKVIEGDRFAQMGVPQGLIPLILASWEQDHPTMYGRFDLAYDGQGGRPKMLEYNADTPTSLLEAAVVQWHWLTELFPQADQFNSIHEQLIDAWAWMKANIFMEHPVHFASLDDIEDEITVAYMMDTAQQAGVSTRRILLKDIGWKAQTRQFVDLDNEPIVSLFKLYPWEWLVQDTFWRHLRDEFGKMIWIEPAWKVLLSCKGILPILWELNPGHPLLLEAYFDSPGSMRDYVRKPRFSREGANVTVFSGGRTYESPGDYGEEGYIYQALAPVPQFDGSYPILGSWIIGDEACGMGIRESRTPVTDNRSRFIPHVFI